MAEKICVSCSTANEAHFTYCKYCGAVLPVVDKIQPETPAPQEEKPSFGDISYFEYHRFIGSGAENVLYDFNRLQNGALAVFSLPLLFLGLFFGFFGLSAWFFYRNLKKWGLILLVIGSLLSLSDAFVNLELNRMLVKELAEILSGNRINLFEAVSGLVSYYSYSVVTLSKYAGFFAAFFVSAIGLTVFKEHCDQRIERIKASYDESCPPLDIVLKKAGGTRPLLAVLPFIAAFILPMIFVLVGAI